MPFTIAETDVVAFMGPHPTNVALTDLTRYVVPSDNDAQLIREGFPWCDVRFLPHSPSEDRVTSKIRVVSNRRDGSLVFRLPMLGAAAVTVTVTVPHSHVMVGDVNSSWPQRSMVLSVKVRASEEDSQHTPAFRMFGLCLGRVAFAHVCYDYQPLVDDTTDLVRVCRAANLNGGTTISGVECKVRVQHNLTGYVQFSVAGWNVEDVQYGHVIVCAQFHKRPFKLVVPADGGHTDLYISSLPGGSLQVPATLEVFRASKDENWLRPGVQAAPVQVVEEFS